MGLMQNIPMIEARLSMTMARAIAVAFGSGEATEQLVYAITGNENMAFKARMQVEHHKAALQ